VYARTVFLSKGLAADFSPFYGLCTIYQRLDFLDYGSEMSLTDIVKPIFAYTLSTAAR
jgi:hypothetical protein